MKHLLITAIAAVLLVVWRAPDLGWPRLEWCRVFFWIHL